VLRICLQKRYVYREPRKAIAGLPAEIVVAHAAGADGVAAEAPGHDSKIGHGATELSP
jgi:hypothetical protein